MRPGFQPGRFRLVPGKCEVGALARVSPPLSEFSNDRSKSKVGRQAEIQEIQGGVPKGGRNRDRVRRLYRDTHCKVIHENDELVLCTVNMQGANWARTESRHIAKFNCLVSMMREQNIDIACLTDLHGCVDERAGLDTRYTSCMVEEFLLVQCGKVGFFMCPAVYKSWDGRAKIWDSDGRVATVVLKIDSCMVAVGAVYVPPAADGNGPMRVEVLKWVQTVTEATPKERCMVFGGDWNSHIGGADTGRQSLLVPSTPGGEEMLKWLEGPMKNQVEIADHRLRLRRRGTWCNGSTGVWYEIDYFVCSSSYVGRCGRLRAVAMGESDHAAKIMDFRIAGVPKDKVKRWRDHGTKQDRPFDVGKLQDVETRKIYQERLDMDITEDMSWTQAAEKICETAQEVLGSRPKPGAGEIPPDVATELRRAKEQARDMFAKARESTSPEEAKELLKESRRLNKVHRAMTRRAVNSQWEGVCNRLQEADKKKNWKSFWAEMRNLKLYGAPPGEAIRFTPEELKTHFAKIGALTNIVDEETLSKADVQKEPCLELEEIPEVEEIEKALRTMRESAAGPDRTTVSMLKHGGEKVLEKVVQTVQHMWVTDPEAWEADMHKAHVIALFKKGDRNDLDNYRGICLLQIISRLVARIAAKRVSKHLEVNDIIATEQWGFRPNRSSTDALFVMSRLVAEAARMDDPDPVILDMMDIKKAYPHCSRNAMDRAMELVGIPPRLRNMLAKLDSHTEYQCKTNMGESEPYTNKRGTREGCPAAPVKFNILHHVATLQVRKAWEEKGLNGSVKVEIMEPKDVCKFDGWKSRGQLEKAGAAPAKSTASLDVVGYADDTTIISRLSQSLEKGR